MAFALKLAIEVRDVLPTLPIDAQEDLWDLFEVLAATVEEQTHVGLLDITMHTFVRVDGPEIVCLAFPLVTDFASKSILIPWINRVRPA